MRSGSVVGSHGWRFPGTLPALALGAKPPRRVPRWLAQLIAGKGAVMMAAGSGGAANARAKAELGWTLRYPSWRQGFPAAYRTAAPGLVRSS